jgi:hypothetical protein
MTVLVKHSKVSTIPDDADTSLVRPSDWNADHTLTGTIDVPNGGTGAATLTGYVKGNGTSAMTAVATVPSTDITGLGTMSTQNATAVAITGGTINGTTIGATSATTVNATTITGQTGVLKGTGQNLLLQSNTFNTTWTRSQSTLTSGQSDPFGGSTAWSIAGDGTNNPHSISQNIAFSSGLIYTYSIYFKKNTNNFVQLSFGAAVGTQFVNFDLDAGTVGTTSASTTGTITSVGSGWYRCSMTATATSSSTAGCIVYLVSSSSAARGESNTLSTSVFMYAAQLELGNTLNTYIPTTTTAVYGTPTLSFSGVSTIGLESNGALYLQPAGTGALQAQATTSTTVGGNARGANAVDWQTFRGSAGQVSSGQYGIVSGGANNTASAFASVVAGGRSNTASATDCFVGGGSSNTAGGGGATITTVVAGKSNTAAGFFNFIGAGFTNSGTSGSAVTTQSGTMNATTAVTLSGSNASIKVGQYISGTSIAADTYVAAISGTSLTLSQAASGSSTSTLSFFTPHGVVVGGGNNQATGSYSFIGGGGDAGTAANRNVASGDWSVVAGGTKNTASGIASFIGGGGTDGSNFGGNTASGQYSGVVVGYGNQATGTGSFVGGGYSNVANAQFSCVLGGARGTTRSIQGNQIFSAHNNPIADSSGISQTGLLVLAVQTTDATATALRSNGAAAGTTNQVILPNNSAYFFRGEVISGVTGGGNTKGWTIEGVIKRGANAASTALVGTPTVVSAFADAGAATWAIAVTADTTNGGLRVTFTGQAATTIRTVCQIRTTEMTF